MNTKKQLKKLLLTLSSTSTIGCSVNSNIDKVNVNVEENKKESKDNETKDPTNEEENALEEESSGGGGGGSSSGGGGGSSWSAPAPAPQPTLQQRFDIWKTSSSSKDDIKKLYKKTDSFKEDLKKYHSRSKEEWLKNDDSDSFYTNWKNTNKNQDTLKNEFTSSNSYNMKLQTYLLQEPNLSKAEWLNNDLSNTNYETWIENNKNDLKNTWKTSDKFTKAKEKFKANWIKSNADLDSKDKFINNAASKSYYDNWIQSQNNQLKQRWTNSQDYTVSKSSYKQAYKNNNDQVSTKEKYAESNSSLVSYTNWVSQNYNLLKNDWVQSNHYDQSKELFKTKWKEYHTNLDTKEKYIKSNPSLVDVDNWKIQNYQLIRSNWKKSDDFKNKLNTFTTNWKTNNSNLDTKDKFINDSVSNSYFETWRLNHPADLVNAWKATSDYTSNYDTFKTNFKAQNSDLDTKSKFVNHDDSNAYYDTWRLKRTNSLKTLWKNSRNYTSSLNKYVSSWKQNNPAFNTKSKFLNDDESNVYYDTWRGQRTQELKNEWKKSSAYANDLSNFKTAWKTNNANLDTKEKFAESDESNSYFNDWRQIEGRVSVLNEWKANHRNSSFDDYKTWFKQQYPTFSTAENYLQSGQNDPMKYWQWKNSGPSELEAAWKKDQTNFNAKYNQFKTNWITDSYNDHINTKEKFANQIEAKPYFVKWKATQNVDLRQNWKNTADYAQSLKTFTDDYIYNTLKQSLRQGTTDQQYMDWVNSRPLDQLNNWTQQSSQYAKTLKTFKDNWYANNPKDQFYAQNFPMNKYLQWKQDESNILKGWQTTNDFDQSYNNWKNGNKKAFTNFRTNILNQKYLLSWIRSERKNNPNFEAFVKAEFAKAKKTNELSWQKLNFNLNKNEFIQDWKTNNVYADNTQKFFNSAISQTYWEKWFKEKIKYDHTKRDALAKRWEDNEFSHNNNTYDKLFKDFTDNDYVFDQYIANLSDKNSPEYTQHLKTRSAEYNKIRTSYVDKNTWFNSLTDAIKKELLYKFTRDNSRVFKKTDFYEKSLLKWLEGQKNVNWDTLEKWLMYEATKDQKRIDDLEGFLRSQLRPGGVNKKWEDMFKKYTKTLSDTKFNNDFLLNKSNWIYDNPEDFQKFFRKSTPVGLMISFLKKPVYSTGGKQDVVLDVPPKTKVHYSTLLHEYLVKRFGPNNGHVTPLFTKKYGAINDYTREIDWDQGAMSHFVHIIKNVFDPHKPEYFQFKDEFLTLLSDVAPLYWEKLHYIHDGYTSSSVVTDAWDTLKDLFGGGVSNSGSSSSKKFKLYGLKKWIKDVRDDSIQSSYFLKKNDLYLSALMSFLVKKETEQVQKDNYKKFLDEKYLEGHTVKNLINGKTMAELSELVTKYLDDVTISNRNFKDHVINDLFKQKLLENPGWTPSISSDNWEDYYMALYKEDRAKMKADFLEVAKEKFKNTKTYSDAFNEAILALANRSKVHETLNINDFSQEADGLYNKFLDKTYLESDKYSDALTAWAEQSFIWSDEFGEKYFNSPQSYIDSKSYISEFNSWKSLESNIIDAYKTSDQGNQDYLNTPIEMYTNDPKKINDFLESIKSRTIGQQFYELSGQALIDARANIKKIYDAAGNKQAEKDFVKYESKDMSGLDLYKQSAQLDSDYEDFIQSEFKSSSDYNFGMSWWADSGTNGKDVYKTSSALAAEYEAYIRKNFKIDSLWDHNASQKWAETKSNAVSLYKNSMQLETDYQEYLEKKYNEDTTTFNQNLDTWSATKSNGFSVYKKDRASSTDYNAFLEAKYTNDFNAWNNDFDSWTSNKNNGKSLYDSLNASTKDYNNYLESKFANSQNFATNLNLWSNDKNNSLSVYTSSSESQKDYEKYLLSEYASDSLENDFSLWSWDNANIVDSYIKSDEATTSYNNFLNIEFEKNTKFQNKFLLEWGMNKQNGLGEYKKSPQLDIDYEQYLNNEFKYDQNKQNQLLKSWIQGHQSLLSEYGNNNQSSVDYNNFVNDQYSDQDIEQDAETWVNSIKNNKRLGLNYYENSNESVVKYDEWKRSVARTEQKYMQNHLNQFELDFNDWATIKDNLIDLYKNTEESNLDYKTWTNNNPLDVDAYLNSKSYETKLDKFMHSVLTWENYGTLFTSEEWDVAKTNESETEDNANSQTNQDANSQTNTDVDSQANINSQPDPNPQVNPNPASNGDSQPNPNPQPDSQPNPNPGSTPKPSPAKE